MKNENIVLIELRGLTVIIEDQVRIMEAQLSIFDTLLNKLKYINDFFKPDKEFTEEARNIVIGNISRGIKTKRTIEVRDNGRSVL